MPHEFHVDAESGRLDVLVSGALTPGQANEMQAEVMRLCRLHSLSAILVVPEGISGAPDDLTLHRLGREYAEFARGRVRMAVVKASVRGLDRFFGEVARERGAACRIFDARGEAEAWLARDAACSDGAEPARAAGAGG